MLDATLIESLGAIDTPTLCNALERLAPERQGFGFTRAPLLCAHPELGPIVGMARTARIRAAEPSGRSAAEQRQAELAYYRYMATPPAPALAVIEDVDPGGPVGAWWGEVNTHLHRGLGLRGVVTNGLVRDLDALADGFQVLAGAVGPSHVFVHPIDFDIPVTVAGMAVSHGDLVHADRHGAVVVPPGLASKLAEAARAVVAEERRLIEASRAPGFGLAVLERLLTGQDH